MVEEKQEEENSTHQLEENNNTDDDVENVENGNTIDGEEVGVVDGNVGDSIDENNNVANGSSHEDGDSFIFAVPLKPHSKSCEDVGVSSTPAFQCLDELFADGKLPGARVAFLKAKYQELADLLRNTRDVESHYLHKAKELTQMSQKQLSITGVVSVGRR